MIEHELLMAVAAPLLVAACPGAALIWALPAALRRGTGRLTHGRILQAIWTVAIRPLNATVIHGIAIWIWHVPVSAQPCCSGGGFCRVPAASRPMAARSCISSSRHCTRVRPCGPTGAIVVATNRTWRPAAWKRAPFRS
ncbi:cytochrome c oxidase assembly protein [Mesorhizobium sp. BR115XR7A]|uniref:cytochrome c oxidase assembly protein n=1 Tax=Mesorhizobium sp. BR115XR7A TaxID=2876645 RepID=UPI001CD10765|nr:cytochrome c oxidase assembly protein [Mesorhizobium sp. BR115XR7A]MBZ9905351.1 cytochrome c oxidase assembly protein [Mesorhizobium sp. BR115XR7A]